MAKDTLRKTSDDAAGKGLDQTRPGTVTGDATKGYGQHAANGSDFNQYGNRVDYSQHTATNFK